jgi:hypothetical protein
MARTLHEDRSGNLHSGENVAEAVAALQDLPVSGFLANCCAPESITTIMPQWFIAGKCRERTDAIEKGSRFLRLPFRAFIECIFGLGGGGDSLAMADLTQFKTILS